MEWNNGRGTVKGYVVRNEVEVRIDDLSRLGRVIDAANATKNTTLTIVGPRFALKDQQAAEAEALRLAGRRPWYVHRPWPPAPSARSARSFASSDQVAREHPNRDRSQWRGWRWRRSARGQSKPPSRPATSRFARGRTSSISAFMPESASGERERSLGVPRAQCHQRYPFRGFSDSCRSLTRRTTG